jgi:hypothetical protein
MKEKFRLYYRPWLIVSIFIMGTIAVPRMFGEHKDRVISLTGFAIFFIGVFAVTFLVGGIHHWYREKGGPKRSKKLFGKPEMKKLEELGFTADNENECYAGHFKNYYLTLVPDSNLEDHDILRINALIVPKESQIEILNALAKKYEFSTTDTVSYYTHKIKLPFGRLPNIEKMRKEIELFVDDLRFKNIEAVTVADK